MITPQRCYGGIRLLGSGPSLKNVEKLDAGAVPMIAHMAARGLQVDLDHFAKMAVTLQEDMDRITAEVEAMTGVYCNLDSGDQVSQLLFKTLGLKQARIKFTKSGDRESVENEVLVAVQHTHPVVPKILDFKELSKLNGTYVVPMPKLAQRVKTGEWRMFPRFNTTRVPSGRLSCKEPNLLAMPSRTARGREIRKGFITAPGWCFVSVDESQIEMRVAAHESGDANLLRIYHEREDIYSDFATSAFHLSDERFKDAKGQWQYPTVDRMQHRYPSKTCVLAAIYRVSPSGLLEQMPVICANCHLPATAHTCHRFISLWTEDKCEDILRSFYLQYPGLVQMQRVHDGRARQHTLTWDMWGRLLHMAGVRSIHRWIVSATLREGGNFPIQSGAQGTVKLTMAQVMDDLEDGGLLDVCHPLLQIHDELLFEAREDFADELAGHVASRFESCVRLQVPIQASTAKAQTWGALDK